MVDLGLYNYVKIALGEGKSESDIVSELSKSNFTTENIQEALSAAKKGDAPKKSMSLPSFFNSIITILVILILIAILVLFFTKYKKTAFPFMPDYTSYSVSLNVAPLQAYSDPEIGVTMSVPSDWTVRPNTQSGAEVSGFIASKNVNPFGTDIITAQVNTHTNTPNLPDLITSERATLSSNKSLVLLQDEDMVIGAQPGHLFEYTYVSNSKTYHEMDGYVLNSNTLYVYSASGLDGDWSQIPALSMLKSLTFSTN
jgi:hypothetical protein